MHLDQVFGLPVGAVSPLVERLGLILERGDEARIEPAVGSLECASLH